MHNITERSPWRGIDQTWFHIGILSIGLALTGCNSDPVPDLGETAPMSRNALSAAQDWFQDAGIDRREFSQLPVDERARRLTQAVYAHCEQGARRDSDLNTLFDECVAACGGISYVLRGLLEATGAHTRYVNLYNIPNQGNHTAVEVYLDGRWGFYDPTFGVYFTSDGTAEGQNLGIGDIAALYSPEELSTLVNQARDERVDIVSESLASLYSESFDHPFMSIENYQLAESRSRLDPRELVILDIPLALNNGHAAIGDFQAQDMASAQAGWLAETNALLMDDEIENDISFVSHNLANGETQRLNTITLTGLEAGVRYEMSLFLIADYANVVEVSSMGRTLRHGGPGLLPVDAGRNVVTVEFMAVAEEGRLAVRNLGNTVVVSLLGIEVNQLAPAAN